MFYDTIIPLKEPKPGPMGPYTIRFPDRSGCDECKGGVWSDSYMHTVPLFIPTNTRRERLVDSNTFIRLMPRDGSWKEVVRSGVIKMTPGSVQNERTIYHMGKVTRNSYYYIQVASARVCCGTYVYGDPDRYIIDESVQWTEQGDFAYWSAKHSGLDVISGDPDDEFASNIERAKTEVWSELIRQYDLGTELAELHQTIQFGLSILKAARNPLQTLKKLSVNKPDSFMNAWMSYRYALMPLIYSAQDIAELIASKDVLYKTIRRTIDKSIPNPNIPDSNCFYTMTNGGITARVMAKGRWNTSELKLMGQIGLNPITTAWEVVPLSFVVDWFVNFGDYLTAVSGTWSSMAAQLSGCVSVRTNIESQTFLRLKLEEKTRFTTTFGPLTPYDVERGSNRTVDIPLITHTNNSYVRTLYSNHDLKIVHSPYLNWKRLLDGSILTIRSLQSILRKSR